MGARELEAIASALLAEGRLLIVFTGSVGRRDELIADVSTLAEPGAEVVLTSDAAEALDRLDALVALVPSDEVAALSTLVGRRALLDARKQPLALFLATDGTGAAWLAGPDGAGLASYAHGSMVEDRVEPVEREHLRAGFSAETGLAVEEWLDRYRAGAFVDDDDTARLLARALALEDGSP